MAIVLKIKRYNPSPMVERIASGVFYAIDEKARVRFKIDLFHPYNEWGFSAEPKMIRTFGFGQMSEPVLEYPAVEEEDKLMADWPESTRFTWDYRRELGRRMEGKQPLPYKGYERESNTRDGMNWLVK